MLAKKQYIDETVLGLGGALIASGILVELDITDPGQALVGLGLVCVVRGFWGLFSD